jgi:hypothetical protein
MLARIQQRKVGEFQIAAVALSLMNLTLHRKHLCCGVYIGPISTLY